ncbi:MAG: DUF2804 domain-containing protein [Anaerolineales bacterium]|nr:DUF2804 domain-containing protein [Anaerolineales bacterium]
MQHEITTGGPLLEKDGSLAQVGWARHPNLDCNLEDVNFYTLKFFQRFRVKRWDYYAIFTPNRFFSATIADLGYAGNIFVYTIDFRTGELHEEGLVIPLGKGIILPRSSRSGDAHFANDKISLDFTLDEGTRSLSVSWPGFHEGRGISAEISLAQAREHESMNIVIPIGQKRFYYNHKINCLPASGQIRYGEMEETLLPETSLGQLDWGRGVWEYSSFWKWASASGFLPDGRTIGLNMGGGFGDTSQASENAFILNGILHKLDRVTIDYDPEAHMQPWHFIDNQNRLDLAFFPFVERLATTRLVVIDSEVHQMFGRYFGNVVTDQGEKIEIDGLIGFAEDHRARW